MLVYNKIISILIVLVFYLFGNFGLFNIFGLRNESQFLLTIVILIFLFNKNNFFKINKSCKVLFSFSILFFVCSFARTGSYNFLFYLFLCLIIIHLISSFSREDILFLYKSFVVSCFLLCLPVLTAFLYYYFNIEELNTANWMIYSSLTGSSRSIPNNLIDYFCFTSGDGFTFYSHTIPRMKGYCSEPSSTFLYYFLPSVFGFVLSLKYKLISIFVLFINFLCIGSLSTFIVISLGILIFLFSSFKYFGKLKYAIITTMIFVLADIKSTTYAASLLVKLIPATNILSKK